MRFSIRCRDGLALTDAVCEFHFIPCSIWLFIGLIRHCLNNGDRIHQIIPNILIEFETKVYFPSFAVKGSVFLLSSAMLYAV